MKQHTTAIIGAGYMAKEYYKVLRQMDVPALVLGRGTKKARQFEEELGAKVHTGSYTDVLRTQELLPKSAIVAVNVGALCSVTHELIRLGIRNILVEKPVAISSAELTLLSEAQKKYGANIYVAYNRRFFASVNEARKRILADGGATSFQFEFTEWSHVVGPTKRPPGEKEAWIFANSTHVMDLAFFLGGFPKEMSSYTTGSLDWHPNGSNYAGAGISENGALFSYQANWEAPGRWAVEILTRTHRYYLKPLETLQIQNIGSVKVNPTALDTHSEQAFKPGLYEMVNAFLHHPQDERLLTLEAHTKHFKIYEQIAGTNP